MAGWPGRAGVHSTMMTHFNDSSVFHLHVSQSVFTGWLQFVNHKRRHDEEENSLHLSGSAGFGVNTVLMLGLACCTVSVLYQSTQI